jgi:hypothetical protein
MKSILSIIIALLVMSFISYSLVRCVDAEARLDERKRIAAGLTQDANEMAAYIEFMERVGREKR